MSRAPLLLVLALLLGFPAEASPRRRRPVAARPTPQLSVEAWLQTNAFPIHTAELVPVTTDLEPLRAIAGEADVVALAEATHGTHEFHTIRIRMIDYLVRKLGFDVVIMEAPFPLLNRVNDYVQGRSGESPQAILDHAFELNYYFWDVREMHALFEWARAYNAQRGSAPLLEFAGNDTYDHRTAAQQVIDYLRPLDPSFAVEAEQDYACVFGASRSGCSARASRVLDQLRDRRVELERRSSHRAFGDATQNATVVVQYTSGGTYGARRDEFMASNTLWLRENRGHSRRAIVWAHQEHAGTTPIEWIDNQRSMGQHLETALGPEEYVVIGTTTRVGTYRQWEPRTGRTTTSTFTPATSTGYESLFARGGSNILLIPLQGAVPSWLEGPMTLHSAPANPSTSQTVTTSLPDKLDAIVYFETTTAALTN